MSRARISRDTRGPSPRSRPFPGTRSRARRTIDGSRLVASGERLSPGRMRGDDARIRAADDGELVVGERVGHRGSVGRRDGVGRARRARHLATRGRASRTSHGARVDLVGRDGTDRGRRGDALATGARTARFDSATLAAIRRPRSRASPRTSPGTSPVPPARWETSIRPPTVAWSLSARTANSPSSILAGGFDVVAQNTARRFRVFTRRRGHLGARRDGLGTRARGGRRGERLGRGAENTLRAGRQRRRDGAVVAVAGAFAAAGDDGRVASYRFER